MMKRLLLMILFLAVSMCQAAEVQYVVADPGGRIIGNSASPIVIDGTTVSCGSTTLRGADVDALVYGTTVSWKGGTKRLSQLADFTQKTIAEVKGSGDSEDPKTLRVLEIVLAWHNELCDAVGKPALKKSKGEYKAAVVAAVAAEEAVAFDKRKDAKEK